ncbi:hypothetical protein FKW77_004751 [Venturia effusa]|uniref:Clr5 domain-containing protein n=1 Tax=Venturia effusa TaxID=50376 RepID=A0A517L966_9PEZI|nr:hypothetical protein FKW77_004751 [Venturia effusa]
MSQLERVERSRRKPISASSWSKIRPIVKHYYIDLDMTLQDSMRKIEQEHGFHATEQMYKKRLKIWSLSKQIKSSDKEKALEKLLIDGSIAEEGLIARPDKLVRYAKSLLKRGREVGDHPNSVVIAQPTSLPSSPRLPAEAASLELFLRAMQMLIIKEHQEWRLHPDQAPDTIHTALLEGIELWHNNAFTAARQRLTQAARQTTADLRSQTGTTVFRITFCISSIFWGGSRGPMLQGFAKFMAKAAREASGEDSALTIVLRFLCREQSLDVQLRMWELAMASHQLSEHNFRLWWDMARRQWRWCLGNGLQDLAVQYRDRAIEQVLQMGCLTAETDLLEW